MTEKILSSVKLGVRPNICLICSNSSGRIPNFLAVSTVGSCSTCSTEGGVVRGRPRGWWLVNGDWLVFLCYNESRRKGKILRAEAQLFSKFAAYLSIFCRMQKIGLGFIRLIIGQFHAISQRLPLRLPPWFTNIISTWEWEIVPMPTSKRGLKQWKTCRLNFLRQKWSFRDMGNRIV